MVNLLVEDLWEKLQESPRYQAAIAVNSMEEANKALLNLDLTKWMLS